MKRLNFVAGCCLPALVLLFALSIVAAGENPGGKKKILYYDYTYRFVHTPTIDQDGRPGVCASALKKIAAKYHCDVVCTKDGKVFDGDLSQYAAFVFYTSGELNHPGGTVGAPMSDQGRRNLFAAVDRGAGFLGIHSATVHPLDAKKPDPLGVAYVRMLGANLIGHNKDQEATVEVVDPVELPCLKKTGGSFRHYDEWYAMKNFNPDIHVLLLLKTSGSARRKNAPTPLCPAKRIGVKGKWAITRLISGTSGGISVPGKPETGDVMYSISLIGLSI